MNIGIILAAGKGKRFGTEIAKQFCYLNNKMIIDYSILAFENSKNIDKIMIVTSKEWFKKIANRYPKHIVVEGGETRQEYYSGTSSSIFGFQAALFVDINKLPAN